MALIAGELDEPSCLDTVNVLWDPYTIVVHAPEGELPRCVCPWSAARRHNCAASAWSCRITLPFSYLTPRLHCASASPCCCPAGPRCPSCTASAVLLRAGVPLVGGESVPPRCLGEVLRDTIPLHRPEVALRASEPLVGGEPAPPGPGAASHILVGEPHVL